MMRKTAFVLSITLCQLLPSQRCHSGGWTRQEGSAYAKLAFTTLSTEEAYDQFGNKHKTSPFSTWSLNLYGEYGITNRLTGVVRAPFIRSAKLDNSASFTGPGDFSVELKYGLITGSTPISISVEPEFPTGNADATAPLTDGSGTVPLPTGDGEYNTRLKTSLSHSFYPIPGYVSFDAGYNFRTNDLTDEYLVLVQAGYQIDNGLWLQANINARGPVATPDSTLASKAALGFGEGVQFIAYGVGLAYPVAQQFIISFDLYSAFGKITSIYSGLNLIFGVSYAP